MASKGARAYQRGLGALPPAGVQGAEPPVWDQGAKPPKVDDILTVKHAIFGLNCTSNRTFLKAETGSTVHKNIPQNGIRHTAESPTALASDAAADAEIRCDTLHSLRYTATATTVVICCSI